MWVFMLEGPAMVTSELELELEGEVVIFECLSVRAVCTARSGFPLISIVRIPRRKDRIDGDTMYSDRCPNSGTSVPD